MGKYINIVEGKALGTTFQNKIETLLEIGAESVPVPSEWEEGLICVIDNPSKGFAAAGYAYSEQEMNYFISGRGGRPWSWFKLENAKSYATD